ncbi:MAG: T9SS type A sorting domain-containing protein [Flavobacterium sp.]|nr:T9SS type A sorting domain-containing protein [Flavobacterium sp.]
MKNCILVFVFLSVVLSTNSQTPFSFYPSFNPIEAGLGFGSKVDLDGNEIIASNQRTLVYVFDKNTNGVQQKQIIYSPNASDGTFGYAISIENNRIAIGDPLINSVAENAGSVFIYSKTGDLYDLQQIIPSPEATLNYHFGSYVKIFGNHLFIAAENQVNYQNASSNVGSVYHYLYNGTEWVFQQKLIGTAPNAYYGKKIEFNGNMLVIYTRNNSNNGHGIDFLIFSNNQYVSVGGYSAEGLEDEFDFCLDDNNLSILKNRVVNVLTFNNDNSFSGTGYFQIAPEIHGDHLFSTIAAIDDNLFIGSNSYILQMTRKFPVLHYKKAGNTYSYQSSYFGAGPSGEDDYFGSVLVSKGNSLIIGAPLERIILPYSGNVYVLDYLLANEQFEYNAISVFPNPTSDRVFVNNSSSLAISKIEMYSVSGKLLQTQNSNFNEISLENFSTGLYFAKIYSQSEVFLTFKIVKN